ncbi:hypothetical protein FQA39_LY06762 [Lamprigera yunnana]|nr:hypothetical protein FQA39_LY06762 [Lamprigera yunnana]
MKIGAALIIGALLFSHVIDSVPDDNLPDLEYKLNGSYRNHESKSGDTSNNKASLYNDGNRGKHHGQSVIKKLADQNLPHRTRHRHGKTKFLNFTEKQSARQRILSDAFSQIHRRKRVSNVKDGVTRYTYNPVVPCQGWGYYTPYRCVECKCTRKACAKRCEKTFSTKKPFSDQHMLKPPPEFKPNDNDNRSTSQKPIPHIYDGPGKYWIGPKLGCNCNIRGSELSTCDIRTGQCRCKQNYIGRTCDKCREGYWENIDGCVKCECDTDGSYNSICNERTGQCKCKSGIGGIKCNICLPNYFGFSSAGCKECEPCNKRGHICDPDTGHCICPAYSHGEFCQLCSINAWGYEPNKGCKTCNCSNSGSLKMQCDLFTGECNCRLGYTGFNCYKCEHGYFGYPRCRRCNCNYAGSDIYKSNCDKNGICQCEEDGSCTCKSNVEGKRCDVCKEGTFGLHLDNPDGCTQCFCFGRSSKCSESGLTWGQIRINSSRQLKVEPSINKTLQIENLEKLLIIPSNYDNVTTNKYEFDSPLYWRLPLQFVGDRILSYGGYLRFNSNTFNPRSHFPQEVLSQYPLVHMRGLDKIELEYYPPLPLKGNHYEIRFHESLWKRIYPKQINLSPRELFMIALQNIQDIFVKATDFASFEFLTLSDVILDTAIEVPGHPPPLAKGVEMCECPQQYNSSSCQNPSIGFFRYYTPNSVNGTILIDTFVGQAQPCACNNRSDVCDTETGFCLNCENNTDGRYCEKCADGYYGNPMNALEKCKPCPCPSSTQNFAKDCKPLKANQFLCKCKVGYTGPKCDRCSSGYYGRPKISGGSCEPCNCNIEGRISDECDSITGACFCKLGITGKHCSQCEKSRHVLQDYKCKSCDKCTEWLLDDLDQLSVDLDQHTYLLLNGSIEPPWGALRSIEKDYVLLNDKLALHLEQKNLAESLIANSTINKLEQQLNRLENKLNKYNIDQYVHDVKKLQGDISALGQKINADKQQLKNLIDILQNFGKSHINTQEAIEKAKNILQYIEGISKSLNMPHKKILQKCNDVKDSIESIMSQITINPQTLKNDLTETNDRLKDMEVMVTKTKTTKNEADLKNQANKIKFRHLQNINEDIKKRATETSNDLTDANIIMTGTLEKLDEIHKMYKNLDTNKDFNNLVQRLENREADLNFVNSDVIRQQVLKHTEELEQNATNYAKLFNLSSKEINALKASEAYSTIKKFIEEADDLASRALLDVNVALNTLSPEGKDSIAINASISMADSERLEIRIRHQMDKVTGLKQKKDNLSIQVDKLNNANWDNGFANNGEDTIIIEMKNKLSLLNKEKIQDLITDAVKQTGQMKDIYRKVININMSKDYELVKPYIRLLNLTSVDNLKKLQDQITVTHQELQNVLKGKHTSLDIIKQNTIQFNQFREANNSIALKLQALKAKIQSTKKTSEGIRVSLAGPTCQRYYKINTLSPALVSKLLIKFNYTLSSEPNSNSLFYINTSSHQFMDLKIENNNLVFELKLGNTIKKQEYPLRNDFYTVEIERIGEYLKMIVNNEDIPINNESENETPIFNTTPENLVHIGFSPNTQPGIPGCVRDVVFNNFKIGLWNFNKSIGECLGCIRSNELTLESTYDFYGGDGYSLISKEQQEKNANPAKFNVQFSLRTFDENALLFLAPDIERKNYIAIFLKDGYIYYQVHYSNDKDMILNTTQKYNNGEKVRISAEKLWHRKSKQDIAVLRINESERIRETRNDTDSNGILRLKKVNYYFGGVPPDYLLQSSGVTDKLHTHESLMGGLEELKEYQLFSDDNMKKYGITKQSGELEFHKALFEGSGYITIEIKKLVNSLLFLLNTKTPNGFVMYLEGAVAIYMNASKIEIKLYIKDETFTLSSKQITNENYHLVELIIYNKKAVLKLNGNIEDTIKTKEFDTNSANTTTNLHLGGVPETFSNLLQGKSLFSGSISDILINNNLLVFNKQNVKYFERVRIGRQTVMYHQIQVPKNFEQPEQEKQTDVMKEMQNTEGCASPLNYTFDLNAAKFGDKLHSYVLHFLKDTFWRKDYKIGISFRTFQPNGVLFAAFGPKQHFNLLEIRNGKVVFKSNGKKLRVIELPQKVDDGNWYNLVIDANGIKKKRKLVISINGYKTKPLKLPRNKVTRELYVGGISDNVTLPTLLRGDFHIFRGCMRGLTINKIPQGLVRDKNTLHFNIGQCFPHIEKGSYFGGDAYVTFNKFFRISKILEVSLEFRTADQNGILLSVSNPRNSPALSIELQNGAIVMTTDNGYGTITNVTNNLSDFALCDNHWHNITAVYTSTEITINVDGIRKIWVQSDDETLIDELEAPLYIGGLPDYAPVGTLKMKENFKGCIRSMKICNSIVDWLNVEKMYNVQSDSCPMTP